MRGVGDDVDNLQLVFRIMDRAGPLKGVAEAGSKMLERVEDVSDKIAGKIDALADRIDHSKVKEAVGQVTEGIRTIDGYVAKGEAKVDAHREGLDEVASIAAKAYTFAEESLDLLSLLATPPNAAVREVDESYDALKARIKGFTDSLPRSDLDLLVEIEIDLSAVTDLLAGIRKPLQAVYDVIKPIEPLLGAVDFVASRTVDPVIDFILNTLRIDEVIDKTSDLLTRQLPDLTDFDIVSKAFGEAIDRVKSALSEEKGDFDHDNSETEVDRNGDLVDHDRFDDTNTERLTTGSASARGSRRPKASSCKPWMRCATRRVAWRATSARPSAR